MPASPAAVPAKWFHRGAQLMLLAAIVSCDADAPASPGTPSTPDYPAVPAAPAAPATAPLVFSDSNVVFNAMSGAAPAGPIVVTVSARPESRSRRRPSRPAITAGKAPAGSRRGSMRTPRRRRSRSARRLHHSPRASTRQPCRSPSPGEAAQSVTVTARVVTAAAIGLSASKICFTTTEGGTIPHRDDVRITSVDGSVIDPLTVTVEYGEGQPTGWLNVLFRPRDRPEPAVAQVPSIRGSAAGDLYRNGARVLTQCQHGPVSIAVTLTINPPIPLPESLLEVSIALGARPVWRDRNDQRERRPALPPQPCTGHLQADVGSVGDITAIADADYGARFIRWEGACTGNESTCTVNFPAPGTIKSLTGVFGPAPSNVNMLLRGEGASGTVTVTPVIAGAGGPLTCTIVDGVAQPGCSGLLESGVGEVTLTATPAAGSVFVGWEISASNTWFPEEGNTTCANPVGDHLHPDPGARCLGHRWIRELREVALTPARRGSAPARATSWSSPGTSPESGCRAAHPPRGSSRPTSAGRH